VLWIRGIGKKGRGRSIWAHLEHLRPSKVPGARSLENNASEDAPVRDLTGAKAREDVREMIYFPHMVRI
jgi:hypothetical protein